jgi:hypothetical protein
LRNLKRREIALMIVGVMVGAIMLTPASAHVGGTPAHLWTKHLKPLAKQLFYTKTQVYTKTQSNNKFLSMSSTLKPGQTLTGIYGMAGVGGTFPHTAIPFFPKLPAGLPDGNGHLIEVGESFTANCPGHGQAAPGHLCVYEVHQSGSSSSEDFTDPYSATAGIRKNGTLLWIQFSSDGYSRGNWAVRAPLAGTSTTSATISRTVRSPSPAL